MARNWSRDEPELDWEDWNARYENRPILDVCPVCGEPVYGEDDFFEADDAYEFGEDVVHSDCVKKYLDRNGYKVEE